MTVPFILYIYIIFPFSERLDDISFILIFPGISFIGDFRTRLPNPSAIHAAQELIRCGVENGKIIGNYVLKGHRDVGNTECPGQTLYDYIQTWPHYNRHWSMSRLRMREGAEEDRQVLSVFKIVHILQNKMLLIVLVIGQNISSNTYKKSKTRDHYFSRD